LKLEILLWLSVIFNRRLSSCTSYSTE